MKNIYFLFLFCIFANCSRPKPSPDHAKVIDLKGDVSITKVMNLSEVAEDITYLPLETNDSCLIGQIDKIIIRDSVILIFDRMMKNVYLFGSSGKFLRKVANKGKGPLEYNGLQFVTMDSEGKNIYIGTFDRKIKVYDLQGCLVRCIDLNQFAHTALIREKTILLTYPYPYKLSVNNYLFCEVDLEGKEIGRYCHQFNPNIKPNDRILYAKTYLLNDTLNFWEKYSDTIFAISRNNKVLPRWVFKLPEPAQGKEKYAKVVNDSYDTGLNLFGFIETSNYFFLLTILNRYRNFLFFDKRSGDLIKVVPGNSLAQYGFNDDLSGGLPFWPTFGQGDHLYSFAESEALKTGLLETGHLKKSTFLLPGKRNELLNILNSKKDSDNPVIIIVDLK